MRYSTVHVFNILQSNRFLKEGNLMTDPERNSGAEPVLKTELGNVIVLGGEQADG